MLLYLIAAVGGAGLLLLALKAWAGQKAKPKAPTGFTFRTSSSEIDRYVKGADDWWQHLRWMPLFWVGTLGSVIMLMLALHYGQVRGEQWGIVGIIIVASVFGIADMAIPFIALNDATDDGKRSVTGSALLAVATVMSCMAMIGSTSEIATTTAARMDTGISTSADTRKLLEAKQKERDSIPIDRGAQALNDLAKATEEAADREGNRTRCGQKCEELKKQAADYRARAKEADRKEKLTGEIEQIKARMSGAGTAEQRTDADAMATIVSGMSGGLISREGFRVYGLTVLGLVLVTLLTLLWVYVGGHLNEAIIDERQYRGEIADEQLEQLGKARRYTVPAAPMVALPAPSGHTTARNDPSVILNVSLSDMRKRFANDADLLEADGMFETLLMAGEGGAVKVSALHQAYRIVRLSADPNARYMTLPTLTAKLMIIAQHRDDMRVTADGVIEGWVLKPAAERTATTEATTNVH